VAGRGFDHQLPSSDNISNESCFALCLVIIELAEILEFQKFSLALL